MFDLNVLIQSTDLQDLLSKREIIPVVAAVVTGE